MSVTQTQETPKPTLEELVQKEMTPAQAVEAKDELAAGAEDVAKTEESAGESDEDDDSQVEDQDAGDDGDSGEQADSGETVEEEEDEGDIAAKSGLPVKLSPVGEFLRKEFIRKGYDEDEVNSLTEDELRAQWVAVEETEKRRYKPPQDDEEDTDEEDTRSNAATSKADSQPEDKPEEKNGPSLKPLTYDQADEKLVMWESVEGVSVAVPKDKTGTKGREAAERLNAWAEQWRSRQRMLTQDPLSLLAPDLQKIVDAEVKKALSKYEEEKVKQVQEHVKATQEVAENDSVRNFFDQHRADLFVVGKDGRPKKSLATNSDMLSERGKQFEEIYVQLAETSSAPRSKLLVKAMTMLNKFNPPKAPEPKETKVEKRRSFLDKGRKNKATALVASNPPARPDERSRVNGGKKSLADLMLQDADLADNPFVGLLARASS
jgi:hypothetical protein